MSVNTIEAEYSSGMEVVIDAVIKYLESDHIDYNKMFANLSNGMSTMASAISALTREANIAKLQKIAETIKESLSRLCELPTDSMEIEVEIPNYEKAKETMEQLSPYIEKAAGKEKSETFLQKFKRKMSFSNIITIISLLLAIYTSIISTLPDEQLDEMISQNDVIISQSNTIIEQNDIHIQQQSDSNKLSHEQAELLEEIATLIQDLANACEQSEEQMP